MARAMGFYCIYMIQLWTIPGTVEICVLLLIVAAAVVGAAIRPASPDAVETFFATGCLEASTNTAAATVSARVLSDFSVVLIRSNLPGDIASAALAITVKGNDITVEERLTSSVPATAGSTYEATYLLSFLRPSKRYHLFFNSQSQSLHCAFTLLTEPSFTASAHLGL